MKTEIQVTYEHRQKNNKRAYVLKGKKIYIAKRSGELKYSSADIRKAKRLLKWNPKIRLQKGLRQMLKKI